MYYLACMGSVFAHSALVTWSISTPDLNRGHDKSLSYNLDQKTGEWKAEFVRYRYKRDTELVVGCAGCVAAREKSSSHSNCCCMSLSCATTLCLLDPVCTIYCDYLLAIELCGGYLPSLQCENCPHGPPVPTSPLPLSLSHSRAFSLALSLSLSRCVSLTRCRCRCRYLFDCTQAPQDHRVA